MSLDFAILGRSGTPSITVRLSVHDHEALMKLAHYAKSTLVRRIHDYYEDAVFSYTELQDLSEELETMQSVSEHQPSLLHFLREAIKLVHRAILEKQEIHVLAD